MPVYLPEPGNKTIKELRTELYRDDNRNWYRIFIISYMDGSGEKFKFKLEENAENDNDK